MDRVEEVTRVAVYSNRPEVELLVNGRTLDKKSAPEHFFYFDVPNQGESVLTAIAGECRDESRIRKVDTFNEDYRMKETGDDGKESGSEGFTMSGDMLKMLGTMGLEALTAEEILDINRKQNRIKK